MNKQQRKYHSQQIKQHRNRNRFQTWCNEQIDAIFNRVITRSDERRRTFIATLQKEIK